jgi:hypothetical protein
MFDFLLRVKAMQRLGLSGPFRYMFLILFVGCLVAGLIYAYVVFNVVRERSHAPHVHAHSTH